MLRHDSSKIDPDYNKPSPPSEVPSGSKGLDIQQELNQLEDIILASPRVPLTRRTLVDEEQLLDHLDLVRLHLPTAFQEAQAIIQQKKEILLEAEQRAEKTLLEAKQYAEEILQTAEARAAQILNEIDIIQLAELEAKHIQQEAQQECEAAKEQTWAEIDQMRRKSQQELEEMRLLAIAEFEAIQKGADEYADSVLENMEQQFNGMLRIIRNGRQELQPDLPNRNLPSSFEKI